MLSEPVPLDVVKKWLDLNSEVARTDQSFLLVDCRPFFSFNEAHIRGAVNVFCSKFLLRRRGQSGLVERVFVDPLVRRRLLAPGPLERAYDMIVLYEQSHCTGRDSVGALLARALEDELPDSCIGFMEGGFEHFSRRYPELVTSTAHCLRHDDPALSSSASSSASSSSSSSSFSSSPLSLPTISIAPPSDDAEPDIPNVRRTLPRPKLSLALLEPVDDLPRAGLPFGVSSAEDEDAPEPSQLTPYLYIGSQAHSNSFEVLTRLGITAILNVSSSCPNYFERDFLYKRIFLRDNGDCDIQDVMAESIDFIKSVRESNGKVLVHCRAGMSRSATMCIAYLIERNRWTLDRAYEFVKQRRPQIAPNFSFMLQMKDFEKKRLQNDDVRSRNDDDEVDEDEEESSSISLASSLSASSIS